jgi:hypothetical protein
MRKNQEMQITKAEEEDFKRCKKCHICNRNFGESELKVRDHDHITGKYRGAAHKKCNIDYFSNRYVPVVFHNLRGYDGHLIIKNAYHAIQSFR